jgi:hypothetical protein
MGTPCVENLGEQQVASSMPKGQAEGSACPLFSLIHICGLAGAEYGACDRLRPLADTIAIVARFDDPLAIAGTSRDDTDMMRPDDYGTDPRSAGPSVMPPVGSKVIFRTATELRPHPPTAPSARTASY